MPEDGLPDLGLTDLFKELVHLLRQKSWFRLFAGGAVRRSGGVREERTIHGPLALLFLVLGVLINLDLAISGEADLVALERTRRGTLDVDAGDHEAGAMARALEGAA